MRSRWRINLVYLMRLVQYFTREPVPLSRYLVCLEDKLGEGYSRSEGVLRLRLVGVSWLKHPYQARIVIQHNNMDQIRLSLGVSQFRF